MTKTERNWRRLKPRYHFEENEHCTRLINPNVFFFGCMNTEVHVWIINVSSVLTIMITSTESYADMNFQPNIREIRYEISCSEASSPQITGNLLLYFVLCLKKSATWNYTHNNNKELCTTGNYTHNICIKLYT